METLLMLAAAIGAAAAFAARKAPNDVKQLGCIAAEENRRSMELAKPVVVEHRETPREHPAIQKYREVNLVRIEQLNLAIHFHNHADSLIGDERARKIYRNRIAKDLREFGFRDIDEE